MTSSRVLATARTAVSAAAPGSVGWQRTQRRRGVELSPPTVVVEREKGTGGGADQSGPAASASKIGKPRFLFTQNT